MSIRDLFKRKQAPKSSVANDMNTKDAFFKNFFMELAQHPPSEHFVSGAVFDITRQQHDVFERIVRSIDAFSLLKFFANAYALFCNNPEVVNFTSDMINTNNNDTDPRQWNADIINLSNGDAAALCFMPIENDTLAARIIGIILSNEGDRYYYCMLNKAENLPSDVLRNKASGGIEKVGEIKGLGFELMHNFLNCMATQRGGTAASSGAVI